MGVSGAIIEGAKHLLKQSSASTAGRSCGLRLATVRSDLCEVALHA